MESKVIDQNIKEQNIKTEKINQLKGIVSKDKLLEAGVQFGHKQHKWNPAMKPFIHGIKDNSHIINLNRTLASLQVTYNAVEKISSMGGSFLFVGTNKQSANTIKLNAERTGSFFVNQRWLGGTLTNFKTIQNSIKKLRHLERLEKNNFEGYTKKEAIKMRRTLEKLEKSLGGIKYMRKLPAAIFISSVVEEKIVIKEANKLNIPVFGIVDTDGDPRSVKFPIFANDDANKSVSLITTIVADAIAKAKGEKSFVVNVEPSSFEILGLNLKSENREERAPYKSNYRNFNRNENFHRNERHVPREENIENKEVKVAIIDNNIKNSTENLEENKKETATIKKINNTAKSEANLKEEKKETKKKVVTSKNKTEEK